MIFKLNLSVLDSSDSNSNTGDSSSNTGMIVGVVVSIVSVVVVIVAIIVALLIRRRRKGKQTITKSLTDQESDANLRYVYVLCVFYVHTVIFTVVFDTYTVRLT